MGCGVTITEDRLTVTPPLDRYDIATPEDVVDEIGRIIGYETLPSVVPPVLSETESLDARFYYAEQAKNVLVKAGYSEVLLYSLVPRGTYEIIYPLASDKSALRESLLPKLTESLIANGRNANLLMLDTIKLCEVGKVFHSTGEKTYLALGVHPVKKKKGVSAESILRSDIAQLEASLRCTITEAIHTSEHCAVVEIDLGALVATLPVQTSLATLNFQPLPRDVQYQKFSPYPFIVRDIAVFVPEATPEALIEQVIIKHAGPLCVRQWLFDVFIKELPAGSQKSCAFRLVFQSFERTLEDGEVNAIMETLTKELMTHEGWTVR
jgi:phenylalanyl-tRNA synthetase beta chain